MALGSSNICSRTLFLIDSENNNNLISPDSDQLLDTSDTTSGQLGQENHAIDVVVFEKFDICAHFGDLTRRISIAASGIAFPVGMSYLLHIHHHEAIDLRILLFIEATVG